MCLFNSFVLFSLKYCAGYLGAHSSCWHSMAVPLKTQCTGGKEVGRDMAVMKLLERPVENRLPVRLEVQ